MRQVAKSAHLYCEDNYPSTSGYSPGYYWADETEDLNGPYEKLTDAKWAQEIYCRMLSFEPAAAPLVMFLYAIEIAAQELS